MYLASTQQTPHLKSQHPSLPRPPTLPALLAGGAQPGFVLLVVDPTGLADVVVAVVALAPGVEQEGEGRAASDAAALVEATLP